MEAEFWWKGVGILEFTTFYQNALHLTRLHCATFYQSASRHEQHEDVTPAIRPCCSLQIRTINCDTGIP